MIDLHRNEEVLEKSVQRARERNILLPTLHQMAHPEEVPEKIKEKLKHTDLWAVDPVNLFRITWKNEPREQGGGYGNVNYLEFPPELTGVPAKIIALTGKWFPTGCHKVGASFGCLAPRLVTGQFDPSFHRAVWPSTGNFCRGGAYNSALLGCRAVAILPEDMSRERFEWLHSIAGEVIKTPGGESNVKQIFDTAAEMKRTQPDVMVFNQFEELGNHLWHYSVTGPALEEAVKDCGGRLAGCCFTSGSGGTLGAGDYLKEAFPGSRLAVGEALQCPTLLENGYGEHQIEGIGDRHVPWIHNVKNTDMVMAIDDRDCMALLRLFHEEAGREYLVREAGVPKELVDKLGLLGISGIANLLCAIKFARYYELTSKDVVATVLTDSAAMYQSRLEEMASRQGDYTLVRAVACHAGVLLGQKTDALLELSYYEKKRIHNLKYYTWIEQQGRCVEELNQQWYDAEEYWGGVHQQKEEIDRCIREFNTAVGLV